MPPPISSASTPVKRACDSCHRRKVKCIGEGTNPCKNCVAAGLQCTYNAIPQKKGPKGSRAKVLSELRETQRQTHYPTSWQNDLTLSSPADTHSLSRTPGLVSPNLIAECSEFYFTSMYPSQPIISRQQLQQAIAIMDQDQEAYCLITSLCAYTMIKPGMHMPQNLEFKVEDGLSLNANSGNMLLEETVRCRKLYNYVEDPSLNSITISYFLHGCYFCLDRHNQAWFHLREATTHAFLMDMNDEASYKLGDHADLIRKRRMYWLLFVTERAYALYKHRPLTLPATIQLPTLEESPTESLTMSGFLHLVNLYKPFDDSFIGLWNKAKTGCLPTWLAQMQTQLCDALPGYIQSTEVQAVDIRTTQQWLRTMVWQLSISHGFISSMSSDNTMSFKYPIEISRDMIAMSTQFSQQAMEVHGVGLVEKLFDVACTLTDVMAYVPFEQNTYELGPRDYLNRFISIISSLRGGQSRYLPLLMTKVQEVLPNMGFTNSHPQTIMPSPNVGTPSQIDDMYETSSAPAEGSPVTSLVQLRHNSRSEPTPTLPSHFGTVSPHTTSATYPSYSPIAQTFPRQGSMSTVVTTASSMGSSFYSSQHEFGSRQNSFGIS